MAVIHTCRCQARIQGYNWLLLVCAGICQPVDKTMLHIGQMWRYTRSNCKHQNISIMLLKKKQEYKFQSFSSLNCIGAWGERGHRGQRGQRRRRGQITNFNSLLLFCKDIAHIASGTLSLTLSFFGKILGWFGRLSRWSRILFQTGRQTDSLRCPNGLEKTSFYDAGVLGV